MSRSPTATLAIEGELSIYRAAELCELLKTALNEASSLEINLAGVTEMDSAGVQLLMAAKKSALARHSSLHLTGHSPAVLEVFEKLDLAAHFGDALVIPATAP